MSSDSSSDRRPGRGAARTLLALFVLAAAWVAQRQGWIALPETGAATADPAVAEVTTDGGAALVRGLFEAERSGVMVEVRGVVDRVLSDDDEGSRHQRFVLELADGLTVLVAHNIDLALRVPIRRGDAVELRGQYEWNDRGGVLHWTHHDPDGDHAEGWIRHAGRAYE